MSQIIKPVMLDETGQVTNQKIDALKTDITQALTTLSTNINATLTNYAQSQEGTLSEFSEDLNETLSDYAQSQEETLETFAGNINTTITNLANDLVGVLVSLKSVNGKYGAVILDSGDILISKNVDESKTVRQIISEMQEAISMTPLSFDAEQIEEDDYLMIITQGTPE